MFHHAPTAQIHIGSIGWENEDEYYFLGTEDNDGHTLVRVQLFEGRDPTKPLSPSRAQGTRLIAHINAGQRIPPKDTRCYVAIPAGMEQTPGAAFIMGTVEKTLDGRLDGDRVVMDFGADTHVVIKAKSVSISDYENRFISVGTPRSGGDPGLTFQAEDGSGGVVQKGVVSWFVASGGDVKTMVQMTPDKYEVLNKVSAIASNLFRFDATGFAINSPGNGFIIPQTLVLGALGAGSPPYAPSGTVGKISGCVFVSTDT